MKCTNHLSCSSSSKAINYIAGTQLSGSYVDEDAAMAPSLITCDTMFRHADPPCRKVAFVEPERRLFS
jgi:hypothetical protein